MDRHRGRPGRRGRHVAARGDQAGQPEATSSRTRGGWRCSLSPERRSRVRGDAGARRRPRDLPPRSPTGPSRSRCSPELVLPRRWHEAVDALDLDDAESDAYVRLRTRLQNLQGVESDDDGGLGIAYHRLLGYPNETTGNMPGQCVRALEAWSAADGLDSRSGTAVARLATAACRPASASGSGRTCGSTERISKRAGSIGSARSCTERGVRASRRASGRPRRSPAIPSRWRARPPGSRASPA